MLEGVRVVHALARREKMVRGWGRQEAAAVTGGSAEEYGSRVNGYRTGISRVRTAAPVRKGFVGCRETVNDLLKC